MRDQQTRPMDVALWLLIIVLFVLAVQTFRWSL